MKFFSAKKAAGVIFFHKSSGELLAATTKKTVRLKVSENAPPDSIRWIFACPEAKNNFFSVLNLQGRQTSLPFLCRVGCFTANSLDDGKAICLGMLRPKIEQRSR
ncbi:MAG: hypothetical protein GY743_11840 [Planctomycetaceae bacterium]|nr:hypothetical protein [Planctomycetaceae bacterium]